MNTKAFTLLELLVVIAIIASIAVLAVPNFMAARERSRDVKRKSDLKQIRSALELYKNDQNPPQYPDPASGVFPPGTGIPFVANGVTYMRSFPGDPTNGYQYVYNRWTSLTYDYAACLENKADPDGIACSSLSYSLPFTCTSGVCYVVKEP